MDNPLKVFAIFLIIGTILFLSYIATRLIGIKARKMMSGKYISIIETVNLGMDKQLHLVKAGGQFILISSTGKSIAFLTTIDIEGYEEETEEENFGIAGFKQLLDKYVQLYKSRKEEKKTNQVPPRSGEAKTGEVFRTNLERLKTLTKGISQEENADKDEVTNEK